MQSGPISCCGGVKVLDGADHILTRADSKLCIVRSPLNFKTPHDLVAPGQLKRIN